MNQRDILLDIYNKICSPNPIVLPNDLRNYLDTIVEYAAYQKGVFTVLITLLIQKIYNPKQDIRYHQEGMEQGFSGRSIDTKYITPTLKEVGLPAMAESGWLTRSLEQPFPYTLDYQGKISNKKVKNAFLLILDYVEKSEIDVKSTVLYLIKNTKEKIVNSVVICPLENPDLLTIDKIITMLSEHFSFGYKVSGGSKLPVIAYYCIYTFLVQEIYRYKNKILKPLSSHTASDRTSKSAGDIEVFNADNQKLYEAIEIKYDKSVDLHVLRIAYDKIVNFNPVRYYILTTKSVEITQEMQLIIDDVKTKHGCQIIVNGLLPTLKYYLRLIEDLASFWQNYSEAVQNDMELKQEHKAYLNLLVKKMDEGKM